MKFSLAQLDRRVVYFVLLIALSVPLILGLVVKPARMENAEKFYKLVETTHFGKGDFAFVALDYGPNSMAENQPQAEVVVEHLMRRRIPLAFFSQVQIAEPFLNSVPEGVARRLEAEKPGEHWAYGKDWVNLGYRPGGFVIIQAIPKSQNLVELFNKDVRGNSLSDLPAFKDVRTFENMKIFVELTSLVGAFETYVQFLQKKDFRPIFLHGCTSITIPKAYIYMDSGQLQGLLEGVAGAAWYSRLLTESHPARAQDNSLTINTALGVAHLVVIALILLGNLSDLRRRPKEAR